MAEVAEVKTIGEVERIVLASGLYAGTEPVEFSNNGALLSWAEVWLPSEEHPHPTFARVTTHRHGVPVPTRVTIRWDEQFPAAAEEWAEKWKHSPMRHFGRTARMVALRQAFRDLLGDIMVEDEPDAHEPMPGETPAPPVRDWAAEIASTETVEALDDIVRAARKARVFTPDAAGTALDRQWKARRRDLIIARDAQAEEKPVTAKPAPPVKSPEPERKPRKRRTPRARNSVADNIDADVAAALAQFGSKAKA